MPFKPTPTNFDIRSKAYTIPFFKIILSSLAFKSIDVHKTHPYWIKVKSKRCEASTKSSEESYIFNLVFLSEKSDTSMFLAAAEEMSYHRLWLKPCDICQFG